MTAFNTTSSYYPDDTPPNTGTVASSQGELQDPLSSFHIPWSPTMLHPSVEQSQPQQQQHEGHQSFMNDFNPAHIMGSCGVGQEAFNTSIYQSPVYQNNDIENASQSSSAHHHQRTQQQQHTDIHALLSDSNDLWHQTHYSDDETSRSHHRPSFSTHTPQDLGPSFNDSSSTSSWPPSSHVQQQEQQQQQQQQQHQQHHAAPTTTNSQATWPVQQPHLHESSLLENDFSFDFLASPTKKTAFEPMRDHRNQELKKEPTPPPPTPLAPAPQLSTLLPSSSTFGQNYPLTTFKTGMVTARIMQEEAVANKVRPQIQAYLMARDPVAFGERTVVILTGKVAQKSYGTEKRFLCPPPTVILDGQSWWTAPSLAKEEERLPAIDPQTGTSAPQLTVTISGESSVVQAGQTDWFSEGGALVGQTGQQQQQQQQQQHQPPQQQKKNHHGEADVDWYRSNGRGLAGGRCVLRQLYINDADEKRKRVECLVRIQLANGIHIGTLASKGIKVISKPSKKRQSVKNLDSCIHHGTTISLFNRIRSQTVSTKYLGVSSTSNQQPFMYPGKEKARRSTPQDGSTCFAARTGTWDPFVIWLVDTSPTQTNFHHSADGTSMSAADSGTSNVAEYIGVPGTEDVPYPPAPAIALKNKTGQPLAIHYNQHVALQCLTTGLVSPVMIIRKVDRQSTVVGGAATEVSGGGGEYGDETLGDPVSQLHKVAFQIVQEASTAEDSNRTSWMMPRCNRPVTYLACLNDMVGMHRSVKGRRPPAAMTMPPPPPPTAAQRPRSRSDFDSTLLQHASLLGKRTRSISGSDDYLESTQPTTMDLGQYWSEDVSDAAVWTIIGTGCAKYTFWEPQPQQPQQQHQSASQPSPPTTPAPRHPVTPVPMLTQIIQQQGGTTLSLYGENFTRDLQLWFGDVRSPRTEYRSREHLVCQVPPQSDLATCILSDDAIPLLLVRGNGSVVYKTNKTFAF